MKNRLYYFLLPVYLFVVGFVLMVNGVFSGQVTSVGNLAINLTFLLLIGILFLISFFSFSRLNRMTDKLIDEANKIYDAYEKGNLKLWRLTAVRTMSSRTIYWMKLFPATRRRCAVSRPNTG